MASLATPDRLARTSCFSCRRSKRRCDKSLPTCQLCSRRGLECSYPSRRGQTAASPPDSSHETPSAAASVRTGSALDDGETELQSGRTIHVPPSFARTVAIKFMAPNLFRDAWLEVPRLNLVIPEDVTFQLGDSQQVRDTTYKFFRLTKSWMPIVNRKRHVAAVLNTLTPCRRPTALLALCMKLCCLPVLDDNGAERTSLYRLAKRFYSEVESTEDLSVQVLQAAICIAIFEIGDAIYPAAYLTVGVCARYGIAMGLDHVNKEREGGDNRAASWMEIEEARRVWWGVLVLDRFLNFTKPSRTLATQDPDFEDFLPVDDDQFFDGTTQLSDAVRISQAFTFKTGQFPRLCQAIFLVSKTLAAIKSSPGSPDGPSETGWPTDIEQLCRTLESLVRANEREVTIRGLAFCSQSVVSYSGIFLLQHHHWGRLKVRSTQEAELHTFVETRSAFDTLYRIASYLQQGYDEQYLLGGECTFFLAHVAYQAISALMTIGQGNPSTETKERITTIGWLLEHIKARWPLSGVYKSILEANEVVLAAEAT
ncbi:hypothetical protein BKA59DRAFT_471325 [Fusarium tricinctum]|uniref:Zn(2)-C6 fungal-type domain-containing protein n=1 Tax=Fusarium tricinctum TaxID=61284 RepID=A0A8K0S804_9HYPO|nr:hypothetical protein BKA59DRAFT_471325 [Fusarium tricinctum]